MRFRFLLSLFLMAICLPSFGFQRHLLDEGWRFRLGDDCAWATPSFDDSQWRRLDLPHDWSIEGQFDAEAPAGVDGGYLPGGIGWYRLKINNEKLIINNSEQVKLYFEGVYMNSTVYLNGDSIGGHPYGFSGFWIDITDRLQKGDNLLAVRVDNSQQKNCRWYSGSGIYRHVWLYLMDPEGMDDPWKLYIRTKQIFGINQEATMADSATVHISYDNRLDETRTFYDVRLWSPEHPELYTIEVGDLKVEHGFREVRFSPEGMTLNGLPYLLNGGCVHHDNGVLGAASFDDAEWRKARLMKEAGFNAVRTAHNPPSESFLLACDRLGLLVIDEAFDGLRTKKNKFDYHLYFDQWWQEDVDALVLRDRNHPSIIAWSNGNEIFERRKKEAVRTTRKLSERMRQLDPFRPVTQAFCEADSIFDTLAEQIDIVGYNYLANRIDNDHLRCPDRIIWQSESYPDSAFESWSSVIRHPYVIGDFVWSAIDYLGEAGVGRAHYASDSADPGEHWMGKKYPWHGASCGDIDITGQRKPISHYRQTLWDSIPHLYIGVHEPNLYVDSIICTRWSTWPTSQSWTWPGHEGKPIEVEVYSRFSKVALYLNDRLIGTCATNLQNQYKAVFTLPYQPGELKAVGITADGAEATSQSLQTAGEPTGIRLTPSRTQISADGQSLSYVVIELVDASGNIVPNADPEVQISLSGSATLLAVGNADMRDTDSYAAHLAQGLNQATHRLWHGRAIAVIRSGHKAGMLTLKVSAEDFSQRIDIKQGSIILR